MKVTIAKNIEKTRKITFQKPFPKTTECCRCGMKSRLAFVAHEDIHEKGFICNAYEGRKGLWLHDLCCVAVYFCKKCLEPTALYNQG